jgi:DNA-binding transcriptional MocR family regulator
MATSAVALDPRVVSVASLSKCHGAPGLRIGWAISRDSRLVEQLLRAKFGTVLTGSPVTEALALRVFENYDQIMAERRAVLADGVATTAAWVTENADLVEWVRPDAGALCCVRLKSAAFDADGVERFHRTLENHDVRVANGGWFGDEPRVFRLGFGFLPAAELKAAFDTFTAALRA